MVAESGGVCEKPACARNWSLCCANTHVRTMMPDDTSPTRLRVFLCHWSGDKPTVKALYRKLSLDGFDPWLDEEKLLPGQNWDKEIQLAVRNSDIVVACFSNASITRKGYIQKELKFA